MRSVQSNKDAIGRFKFKDGGENGSRRYYGFCEFEGARESTYRNITMAMAITIKASSVPMDNKSIKWPIVNSPANKLESTAAHNNP